MNKAIFFDLDGTLMKPMSFDCHEDGGHIKRLQEKYKIFLVTNQGWIAKGFITERFVRARIYHLQAVLDFQFDGIRICPHHPNITGECECRKPKPGMLTSLRDENNIDMYESIMIGDSDWDMDAGYSAGIPTYSLGRVGIKDNLISILRDL